MLRGVRYVSCLYCLYCPYLQGYTFNMDSCSNMVRFAITQQERTLPWFERDLKVAIASV